MRILPTRSQITHVRPQPPESLVSAVSVPEVQKTSVVRNRLLTMTSHRTPRITSAVTFVLILLGLTLPLAFVDAAELSNPLGKGVTIEVIVGRAVTIFTGLSGSVALLMFMYGGVMWLTSGGNAERVERGKKIFTWATIGLVIIFGAYAILSAIFGAIGAT